MLYQALGRACLLSTSQFWGVVCGDREPVKIWRMCDGLQALNDLLGRADIKTT